MELTPTLILNLALLIVPPVTLVLGPARRRSSLRCPCAGVPAMAGPAHPLGGCLDCSL